MPLPNTRVDLWRTVHDYDVSTIVMLNQLHAHVSSSARFFFSKISFLSSEVPYYHDTYHHHHHHDRSHNHDHYQSRGQQQ